MGQQEYIDLCNEIGALQMERSEWKGGEYHENLWRERSLTVVICQRNMPDLTRLCIESLLTFYPEIPIIVMNGEDEEEPNNSTLYLRFKAAKNKNIQVVPYHGVPDHGVMVATALRDHVKTTYVMLMDGDIITTRGGWIEQILDQFKNDTTGKLYAVGCLMAVTLRNFAIGAPDSREDLLRYAHPSTCVLHMPTYKQMRPAQSHGACLVYSMIDAYKRKLLVEGFPVDKYTCHLSGSGGWQEFDTIWTDDHDVRTKPFVTFITTLPAQLESLKLQTDHDFDIVTLGNYVNKRITTFYPLEIGKTISNYLYDIRFKVVGEYVCFLGENVTELDTELVRKIRLTAIENGAADEFDYGGLLFTERKKWQRTTAIS